MKKNISYFLLLLLFYSCTWTQSQPFCPTLQNIIDSFIINHPKGDVVIIHVDRIENNDWLSIHNSYGYDQYQLDGYWIYKSKMITYYQSDSIDRSPIINSTALAKYDGLIDGYTNIYEDIRFFEPNSEVYVINNKDDILNLNGENSPKIVWKDITQENVIMNIDLNKKLNDYINNNRNVLYELYFYLYAGKQYVSFRSMYSYDKNRYDGFFYRDGYPIVIYGINNAKNILNVDSVERPEAGIPNRKHNTLRSKTYPYPLLFEIKANGKLIEASMDTAWFILNQDV